MTDPDIQHATDQAVSELTRRLRPWATGMADPHAFATRFLADMRAEGWRPPLRPAPDWTKLPRRPTPEDAAETARRGAEMARQALAREDT